MIRLAPITQNRKGLVKADNKHGNVWTAEDNELLKDLYRKGYSIKGIASLVGRSCEACYKQMSKLKKRKERKDG